MNIETLQIFCDVVQHQSFSRGAKSEINPTKPCDVEDFSTALLKLKGGRSLVLETSWAGFLAPEAPAYGLEIFGTNAGINLFPARLFRNGANGYESICLTAPKVPHSEDRIHHFVSCVLDNKKPLVTMEESLKVQQILDSIYTSAETGREVRLK